MCWAVSQFVCSAKLHSSSPVMWQMWVSCVLAGDIYRQIYTHPKPELKWTPSNSTDIIIGKTAVAKRLNLKNCNCWVWNSFNYLCKNHIGLSSASKAPLSSLISQPGWPTHCCPPPAFHEKHRLCVYHFKTNKPGFSMNLFSLVLNSHLKHFYRAHAIERISRKHLLSL